MAGNNKKESPPFKVGDSIKPIEGRRRSNYHTLNSLKIAKINSIRFDYNGRKQLYVTIIEGHSMQDGYSHKPKNSSIIVYSDAFEMYYDTESYSIW